jgi:ribose transport system ATP-binding protein
MVFWTHLQQLLELRGISKWFSGVRVLEGVDFDVRTGEVHALVGENGAGKSTLMNVVNGIVAADAGQMLWQGQPVRPRGPREARELGITFVHQELALAPQLSAAENIFLGRHPAGGVWVRWREIHDRAQELLEGLGCSIDVRRLVADLSLAERQLVEIARALAFRARLIVMDEPTAPLAEHDAIGLFRTVRNLRDRGVGVIFITHRLKEIFQVADRVTVLRDGRRVLSTDVAGASVDDLVRAMVGTELSAHAASQRPATVKGEEAIRVEGPVCFAVRRGEVVGLAGLAGAGRTELLEWLFGAGTQAGQVFVSGRPVKVRTPLDAIRHGMALVPDDRKAKGLVLGATLHHNIALASGRRRWFIRAARERHAAGQLLGELRLKASGLDQPVLYLSGGNQQKAVLAKWLYAGARVFLLDEPTRGIDVRSKGEIYDLVRGLASRGAAVLVASSELEELLRLADRIVVMHRGRMAGELARAEATEERIMRLATGGVL